MDIFNALNTWKKKAVDDIDIIKELNKLSSEDEIRDRFYRELEFGTGGLRGVIGAGTNRMNIYVVRRATQGLCNYIKKSGVERSVAISYDSRIKSSLFANEAARVIAANGITAYIYPRLEPTPALSWAVRYLNCGAGICITASHNPAVYNGYKVYGPDGCQITPHAAADILNEINSLDIFDDIKISGASSEKIKLIPEKCLDEFISAVESLSLSHNGIQNLNVLYTPLNGSGLECVKRILERVGVSNISVVPSQENPDGNFPTCPYPNPEIREAMEEGLKLCQSQKPDILLGTDPDCDRMGTAVFDGNDYRLISGNEMGVLLLDYICRQRLAQGTMPHNPIAVTTIVSTDMADAVAIKYNVELRRVLTGFKYIGEQIGILEKHGEADRFIFGFEESYGYLSGTHVRDKDAVNASMLCCEMTAWYKSKGITLAQAIDSLYREYGYHRCDLSSFSFEGADGMQKMGGIMNKLRSNPPTSLAGNKITYCKDYENGIYNLPKSNVLEFGTKLSKVVIRPSGTEPKIKIYLFARAESMKSAFEINQCMLKELKTSYI